MNLFATIKKFIEKLIFVEYYCPRCKIPMDAIVAKGFIPVGHKIYECPQCYLQYSPSLDVGDKDSLIEKSKGDTRGEI